MGRSQGGVYMNDALSGDAGELPPTTQWVLELQPCLHNIIELCRHFLRVDFSALDRSPACWVRTCEIHSLDATAAAQAYLDAAMEQLSRPGMALRCRASVRSRQNMSQRLMAQWFYVDVDFAANSAAEFRWVLTRRQIGIGDTKTARRLAADCAMDEHGQPIFFTSAHSNIEAYDSSVHGEWQWMSK